MKEEIRKIIRYFAWGQLIIVIGLIVSLLGLEKTVDRGITLTVAGSISIIIFVLCNSYLNRAFKKSHELSKLSEEINGELEYTIPVAAVAVDLYGKIVWYNNMFLEMTNKKEALSKDILEIIPEFNLDPIMHPLEENYDELVEKNFKINENFYDIKTNVINMRNQVTLDNESLHVIYFLDVTDKVNISNKYEDEKTAFGYINIDNFDEILGSTEETKRPMLLGLIERKLQTFAKEQEGTIKKIEKDKFLLFIKKEKLDRVIEGKFKILDEIRKISIGNDLPITLSMGISAFGDSIDQIMENSKDAIELAISRGGDQVVVKKEENDYEYFGAKVKQEVEGTNASKARARIKAYALKEAILDVDNVLIMGHQNPDLDALGSAVGLSRVCKELGRNVYIVIENISNAVDVLYNQVQNDDSYPKNTFISHEEAMQFDSENTLLVVVDVNIPSHTECPMLVEKMDKVAIIDHHIRGAEFIEKAKVIYLDPFASSASEEVVQMAQYMVEKIKFTEIEVDAMLAGILVDTKNFMFKTGVKTFEAAAYLKRAGADNIRVKYLFQNDLDSFRKKAKAIQDVTIYKDNIAITVCPSDIKNPYTLVAQIADDLLNITGIEASFVVYDTGNNACNISARSNGNINVQIIMEQLGGGGHFTAAGVQLSDMDTKKVIKEIKENIDIYLEDGNQML